MVGDAPDRGATAGRHRTRPVRRGGRSSGPRARRGRVGLRDRAALAREVRALSSQARASAALMVIAPVLFLLLASVADARLPRVLFATPAGVACLVAGAALDASGAWWMTVLTRRVS